MTAGNSTTNTIGDEMKISTNCPMFSGPLSHWTYSPKNLMLKSPQPKGELATVQRQAPGLKASFANR
eukprot:CAMPEP_0178937694 /NCGR_PEP_ID=MMETSP0786-20121207/25910_1 /TAXON_ID=186022 /ORGANISM="Thalassionema frauenfeldii, Strain CCMP 1798" /LENGTH=66 /DNA_ID=CAMNT_0020616315 /DNA_START=693 /DNA_END=893 /DNA_ORIENTATION=-